MFIGSWNGCKRILHLKKEGKHDLLTIFSSKGQKQNAAQPLEVADDVS